MGIGSMGGETWHASVKDNRAVGLQDLNVLKIKGLSERL